MKKTVFRWIALCLVMLFVLTGCDPILPQLMNPGLPDAVPFKDMEYSRQDVAQMETLQQAVMDGIAAQDDVETLMEKVFAFYEAYNHYYTGYALANIYYSKDLTDGKWQEEYAFYMDTSAEVDAMLDQMLYALADHPKKDELEADIYFGEGFFDNFEGESLWDETFTALAEKEGELQTQYYDISGQAVDVDPYSETFYSTYGSQLADVYVELVKVRQEMATYAGYEDFPSFAYDFYYGRDYTPAQAEKLMKDIEKQLVPMYKNIDYSPLYEIYSKICTENQTFAYVKSCAQNIGGVMAEAFQLMETAGLYDISYSDQKYDVSFEIYIRDYFEPFVFVNPAGNVRDKLTFVHEFGHFTNDYASFGNVGGIDVAEFFSQGLEYLSLDYATGGKELVTAKMVDSLSLYVEQTAYSTFEHQVYSLEGDQLTKENIYKIFQNVATDFGFGNAVDSRGFVLVPHFFISPMYIISYVVSNDAALQLYQLEQTQKGAGVAKYVENLATMEAQFLGFVESAGLESPFAEGRIEKVRKTFEDALK